MWSSFSFSSETKGWMWDSVEILISMGYRAPYWVDDALMATSVVRPFVCRSSIRCSRLWNRSAVSWASCCFLAFLTCKIPLMISTREIQLPSHTFYPVFRTKNDKSRAHEIQPILMSWWKKLKKHRLGDHRNHNKRKEKTRHPMGVVQNAASVLSHRRWKAQEKRLSGQHHEDRHEEEGTTYGNSLRKKLKFNMNVN